ncbi:hypothetical protein R1flu_000547 [Riccia fluitans]|uniref:Uncharacterized protein n=1 Tax=Riccia fluitans TaxID=41844 RepID=A0ABD1Y3X0_9MARC
MSFYRGEYGRGYREGYNSKQLEYAGYDSNWMLGSGVQYCMIEHTLHGDIMTADTTAITIITAAAMGASIDLGAATVLVFEVQISGRSETGSRDLLPRLQDQDAGVFEKRRLRCVGKDLKPKKILKKVRKTIKASDYWSYWHYSEGVSAHHSGFVSLTSYAPRLRH